MVIRIPWGGTGLFWSYHYFSCLTVLPLFLHSLTSLVSNCLSLLFGTQGRPRRLKPFSTNKEWALIPERATQGLVQFQLHLFFDIPLPSEGNTSRTRKGIKFWIERLIMNSAGELSFRGPSLSVWSARTQQDHCCITGITWHKAAREVVEHQDCSIPPFTGENSPQQTFHHLTLTSTGPRPFPRLVNDKRE